MSVLSYPEWRDKVRAAVVRRKGFAFVRVGDGEGLVIGYPEFIDEAAFDKRIMKWSVLEHPMTKAERVRFADEVRKAVEAANIVGTPGDRHMELNTDWRNARRFLKYYGMIHGDECEMDFSVRAQTLGDWPALLEGVTELYCITCRSVAAQLQHAFKIERVHTFPLAPQVKPCMGPRLTDEPHYPVFYQRAQEWITSRPKGQVFLVGAGGFGKVYCHRIKQCGGVALDVGSLFDGWAGYATRSYLKDNPKAFML